MTRDPALQSTVSYILVNTVRLAFREWPGERGPIICLPHLTGHKGSFAKLAEALAPKYRLLALDMRGRGDSDKPGDGYGFAYHASDIFAFADALGIESFALLGHSFGATTAAYTASLRPERIKALVLLDGGREPPEATLRAMVPTITKLDETYPSPDAYLEAQRRNPFNQPWSAVLDRYFVEDLVTLPDGSVRAKGSAEAILRDLEQHFYYAVRYNLRAITCPTLFLRPKNGLRGDRGQVYSDAEAQLIVEAMPNARRVDVPNVNHYTLLLNDALPAVEPIREFLREMDRD